MFQGCLAQRLARGNNRVDDRMARMSVFREEKHGSQETRGSLAVQVGNKLGPDTLMPVVGEREFFFNLYMQSLLWAMRIKLCFRIQRPLTCLYMSPRIVSHSKPE